MPDDLQTCIATTQTMPYIGSVLESSTRLACTHLDSKKKEIKVESKAREDEFVGACH